MVICNGHLLSILLLFLSILLINCDVSSFGELTQKLYIRISALCKIFYKNGGSPSLSKTSCICRCHGPLNFHISPRDNDNKSSHIIYVDYFKNPHGFLLGWLLCEVNIPFSKFRQNFEILDTFLSLCENDDVYIYIYIYIHFFLSIRIEKVN